MRETVETPLWWTAMQFRLRTLLLVVTWLAVVFAIAGVHPAAGIFAGMLSLPALARTGSYAVQSERVGCPISTGELADTFVFSLVILVALGGTWMLIAASAAGIALLAILSVVTRMCGLVAAVMMRVRGYVLNSLARLNRATTRQVTCLRRVVRRRGAPRWLASAVLLPAIGVCGCTVAVLLGLVASVWAVGLVGLSVSQLGLGVRRIDREVRLGLGYLLRINGQLTRRFRSPSSAEYL